jgi:tetratricopeptide (TPR) repeat protein
MERCALYLDMRIPQRADAMLAEVEPRLQKSLPAEHYAFASLADRRARISLEENKFDAAAKESDRAVAILEAAIKAGGEGAFLLPVLLTDRSDINRAANRLDAAAQDADRAIQLLQASVEPGSYSRKMGLARLALARALEAEHKTAEARSQARQAADQLEKSLGADHPNARAARELAGNANTV